VGGIPSLVPGLVGLKEKRNKAVKKEIKKTKENQKKS